MVIRCSPLSLPLQDGANCGLYVPLASGAPSQNSTGLIEAVYPLGTESPLSEYIPRGLQAVRYGFC